ncbi:hypothetical protein EB001_21125 [bacterium]|nr:hypothetical protein [bacterium]
MPQYKKAFDIGTYTGNGGQYRVGIPTLRGLGPTGTQIGGSSRFRSSNSNFLSKTFVTGNTKKYTWSSWIKRSITGAIDQGLIWASSGGLASEQCGFYFNSDALRYFNVVGNSTNTSLITTQLFKDTSIWYHILFIFDSTQATSTDRVQIWVNGSRVTSFSTATYPPLNQDTYLNNAFSHTIGRDSKSSASYFDGYMSEVYFIDGQALTSSSFGEYNSDGIWVPKAYSGTYGTNGFYLPMNSSSNYATDQSGNGNNWTSSGFNVTTSNTTYDLVTDSPTDYGTDTGTGAQVRGNYATMNSLFNLGSQASIINGGLTATKTTSSGYYNLMFSDFPMSSGKWYWEVTNGSTADISLGITTSITAEKTAGNAGGSSSGYVYSNWTGQKRNNGTSSAYGATFTQNDVIGVALDMDNGTLVFYKNGVSQGTAFTGISGTAFAEIGDAGNTQTTGHLNFGQRAFAYTAPSGYKAVCTTNITRPADSSLWFYGNTPDLMWMKNRSATSSLTFIDTVRGPGLSLAIPSGPAQSSYGVTEINKFGMSIINDATGVLNGSGNGHIYWGWKAGSNTSTTSVTNTNGSQTSQVSAYPAAGFSIVSVTGVASGSFTAGHGLSAAPNFIIAKNLGSGGGGGPVYHSSLGATGAIQIESTGAFSVTSAYWNNTAPTSTVFTSAIGWGATPQIFYCWTAIPGYSAFGSYTGNSSTDGPFVYTGFRPKFIMIKNSTNIAGPSNWVLFDTTRNTYNVSGNLINPNLTGAESVPYGTCMDILSNGFKIRIGADGNFNYSGDTLVYAAFAEAPFKYARAR